MGKNSCIVGLHQDFGSVQALLRRSVVKTVGQNVWDVEARRQFFLEKSIGLSH